MEYPKRKHPRLKTYDYRLPGYYYVTIHTASPEIRLSDILPGPDCGAAVQLTALGRIAQEQLLELQKRYPFIRIDKYVIMPCHIHGIIEIYQGERVESLSSVIGAYKSLTTRVCNQRFQTPGRKIFQASFYETVLRNEKVYRACWQYIDGNPGKWLMNQEDMEAFTTR